MHINAPPTSILYRGMLDQRHQTSTPDVGGIDAEAAEHHEVPETSRQ